MLDDFAERMGPDLLPAPPLGSCSGEGGGGEPAAEGEGGSAGPAVAGEGSGGGGDGGGTTAGGRCAALAGLAGVDGLLDSRFLHLCCPTLDHARQLFSATSGSSGQRPEQARRVKKIRPTAPSGAAAARAALAAAPAAAVGQADGARDLLNLQLQRAFLEQYSTDEHKVGLFVLV